MLAIYRPDRKLAGTIGDGRALEIVMATMIEQITEGMLDHDLIEGPL